MCMCEHICAYISALAVVTVITSDRLKCPTTHPATRRLPLPREEGVRVCHSLKLWPGVC